MNDDEERYICRCEEVTEQEIRDAIRAGAHTVKEIKRWTRSGMGICQGRTCRRLVERILAEELKMKPGDVEISSFRPPVRPVSLESMTPTDPAEPRETEPANQH